tara:strand:- start:288 stop:752 length:465 start_codon:yes stop_codon:yes gene_type:complete
MGGAWTNEIGILMDRGSIILCDVCPCDPCTDGDPLFALLIVTQPVHSCETGTGTQDNVELDLEVTLENTFPVTEVVELEFQISPDGITWSSSTFVPWETSYGFFNIFEHYYSTDEDDFDDCTDVYIRVRVETECGKQEWHEEFTTVAECCGPGI